MLIVTAFHFGKARQNPRRRLICKFPSEYDQSVSFLFVKYASLPIPPPPDIPQIRRQKSYEVQERRK